MNMPCNKLFLQRACCRLTRDNILVSQSQYAQDLRCYTLQRDVMSFCRHLSQREQLTTIAGVVCVRGSAVKLCNISGAS